LFDLGSILKYLLSWIKMAHASNPSYSGGRDQEDRGSRPSGQIVQETKSQKIPNIKKKGLME
jgi:hypothetical protein